MSKYIDATKLMRDGWHLQKQQHEDSGVHILTWFLQDVPAADVRENVRGEWILISKESSNIKKYLCSKCGRHVETSSELPAYLYFPFCHCGADMREKEQEGQI